MNTGDDYLDDEGYPTKEVLEYIKNWDVVDEKSYITLMKFCVEIWAYRKDSIVSKDDVCYYFATMGWSGNESIIGALQENIVFWAMYWAVSERGGLHIFCPMSYDYEYITLPNGACNV